MYKVLTITGGGVRGLIPATILHNLELKTGKRVQDMFDLIVGTSTGGIVAAALGSGYSPKQIMDLYTEKTPEIFSRSFSYKLKSLFGISNSKYSGEGLKNVIHRFLGEKTLSQSECKIILTSYNTLVNDVVLFKSWKEDYKDYKLSDIAIATASAPTYFPPYQIDNKSFIDGGIYANNPVMIGWIEGIKEGYSTDDIEILSLGTGYTSYNGYDTRKWGLLEWLKKGDDNPILDMVFDGVEEKDVYITSQLFKNFNHINPILKKENSRMDNTSKKNLEALVEVGNSWSKLLK